jgi:lipopolysaccharide/colanic/teichoic acid biosynthesis glycosyltransferase
MNNIKKYLILSDIVALYFAIVFAVIARGFVHNRTYFVEGEWLSAHVYIFLPSLIFSLLALYIAGLYDTKILYDRAKVLALLIYTQISTALFSVFFYYIFHTDLTPKYTLFFYIIFSIIFLLLARIIAQSQILKLEKKPALLIGNDSKIIDKVNYDYALFKVSFIKAEKIQTTEDLQVLIEDRENQIIIYDEKSLDEKLLLIIEKLKLYNKNVFSYTQYYEFLYKKVDLENFDWKAFFRKVGEEKESAAHYVFRRFVDIFCGLLVLPIFILVLPIVYLILKLQDKGDIFSVQDRVSYLGRRVWCYKFRTMSFTDVGAFILGDARAESKNKFDNKVTKFGWLLRKSRLDEVPQCINLLRGDISMIGPRADIIGYYEHMLNEIVHYNGRLLAPQGLTGWAQVMMPIQPRNVSDTIEKFAFDIYYIRNRSILLDVSIILKTIKTLLSRTGA